MMMKVLSASRHILVQNN